MTICFSQQPALIAYFTCGDPDLPTTREVAIAAIDAGADLLELGVPFSDPVADGPVIQRASDRALAHGTKLGDVLRLAAEIKQLRPSSQSIVFSYFNPIYRFGLERFCDEAAQAGISGALVTDLIVEEAGQYVAAMRARNLDTVFLASPTSPDDRLEKIAEASRGFVYAISRTGVTGAAANNGGNSASGSPEAEQLVTRLKRFSTVPIAVGFGISDAAGFRQAGQFADAVVVGSAIVSLIHTAGSKSAAIAVHRFLKELRTAAIP